MKTKTLIISLTITLLFLSCNDWIDPELNIDPTSPQDAPLSVILPTTQAGIGLVLGGDMGRFTSLFTQHHLGFDRQHLGLYNYNIKEDDLNNAWVTMNTGPMFDLYIMMSKADATSSPHYKGIAQVLMALSLGLWTDLLGDIPYSESFQGSANLHPKFDSQTDIYNSIQSLLDNAITNLSASTSTFKVGSSDLIYNGSLANWIKAAYTLKARYFLHLQKYSEAISALSNGINSNSGDLDMPFGSTDGESNPLWDFMEERTDIRINPFFADMMTKLNDPRYTLFVDTTTMFPGSLLASIDSKVPFISYAEAKFIEAEAKFRTNDKAGAYTAYLEAITASLNDAGITGTDVDNYIAQPAVGVGENNLTIKNIIEQKYIALYTQPESWTDWRRTGFPTLTPVTGAQIPRRFHYPQNCRLFNGQQLAKVPDYNATPDFIFSKMWWDKIWNP